MTLTAEPGLRGALCGRLTCGRSHVLCSRDRSTRSDTISGKTRTLTLSFPSPSRFCGLCELPAAEPRRGARVTAGTIDQGTLLLFEYDEILQIPTIYTKASVLVSGVRSHPRPGVSRRLPIRIPKRVDSIFDRCSSCTFKISRPTAMSIRPILPRQTLVRRDAVRGGSACGIQNSSERCHATPSFSRVSGLSALGVCLRYRCIVATSAEARKEDPAADPRLGSRPPPAVPIRPTPRS